MLYISTNASLRDALHFHLVLDMNLADLHGCEGLVMRGGAYTGAAMGIHVDRDLRQGSLSQHRVGDHADIRAETNQGNAFNGFSIVHLTETLGKFHGAKGRLIDGLLFDQFCNLRTNLPAF